MSATELSEGETIELAQELTPVVLRAVKRALCEIEMRLETETLKDTHVETLEKLVEILASFLKSVEYWTNEADHG